ncbi:MAG: hypothetical protein GC150_01910 [Rhizobiales bacterium]|nr:hypothetical protein [Hyphomicrobiales bacterium]
MDGDQLQELMDQHGWTPEDVATYLKRNVRTVTRWLENRHPVPYEVALVLEQIAVKNLSPSVSIPAEVSSRPALYENHPMTNKSSHPKLDEYVKTLSTNQDNGVDGVAIVSFDCVRLECEFIYFSDLSTTPESRRSNVAIDESELLEKIAIHAPDIISDAGIGRVATFFIGRHEFAIIQLHERDRENTTAEMVVYINCKGDKSDLLRRNAARLNGKVSKWFKIDEGLASE